LGADLKSKSYQEQFDRYRNSLDNLIITNYIDFQVYKDGVNVAEYSIASIQGSKIISKPDQFETFNSFLVDFSNRIGQTIKSASKLAEMMAHKSKLLALTIESALTSDEENQDNSTLKEQWSAFKDILIHDISEKEFADIYAQTIAYGMFAARLHDISLESFSRKEAAELIPKSNPFLRKLFQYIAGFDLDSRIVWIVDALADIFRAADVASILKNFGKTTQQNDPIIHFYETFLAEYDPKLRKARGVWYTPEPVVNFIIKAVDELLKREFGINDGLSDTSKTKIKVKIANKVTADQRSKIRYSNEDVEVHKVQILDPATGTGTFLAEIIKFIYNNKFQGQEGIWTSYVEEHLIPRLNGFEILMASYSMAHLKLDLLLSETGFKPKKEQRFKVYLTNSLEEYHPDTGTLFANWLSSEANEANAIKRDVPVMAIIGNPPYNILSKNLSDEQRKLVEKYKFINGERVKEKGALQLEKNLNDDYVKFISLGENFVKKNTQGVLAFINNNNFLDALTLRGMRWNLLDTFDQIYILDLHGNSMKKEFSKEGIQDKNVFDIQQGVSINIFVKTGKKKKGELAKVFHSEILGTRDAKYEFLNSNTLSSIPFKSINVREPQYFFVDSDQESEEQYYKGFSLNDLFIKSVTGVKTHRDHFVIGNSKKNIEEKVKLFYDLNISTETIKSNLELIDTGTWNAHKARISGKYDPDFFKTIEYRPFDKLYIYYDENLIDNTREDIMKHFLLGENVGLIIPRQAITNNWSHIQVTDTMVDNRVHYSNKGTSICCPLYIYYDLDSQDLYKEKYRRPNLSDEIVALFANILEAKFTTEKEDSNNTFAPIDLLDYIYALLHHKGYKETYIDFLKRDFPRVPFPKNKQLFWEFVKFGRSLREIHLFKSSESTGYFTKYPIDGDNVVEKFIHVGDKVYINDYQYFDNINKVVWEYHIGGYQPAQKWLKDRKGYKLNYEDIFHYQKIIKVLFETNRIVEEISQIALS